ncbi:MAG: hypothetical protein HY255_05225, partial [Betaproteobacteria bacterium]|nr:hypothetical protein [Betaproteobacteria bacterium]
FQYYNAGTKDIVVADPSDWRTWEYVALKTDSGPPPGGTLLTTMPPGALFGGGVSVPVTSGNHLLFLDVNYQNRVPDDDYSNNSGALNIKVVGPGC